MLAPSRSRPLFNDIVAGALAALVTLAGWLTLGVLAYVSLGESAPEAGIPAACVAVAIGGTVVALLGRSSMPAAGLSSATLLIFASALVSLRTDPVFAVDPAHAGPAGFALLLAAMSSCVILMGLLQAAFGVLRLGSLAKHVPQPVLAGFMSSVALLVLLAQLPMLLGVPTQEWTADPRTALWQAQPATLTVGLATAAIVWLVSWRFPRAPAALLGLLGGLALYAAIRFLLPDVALGPLTGNLPAQLPLPNALAPLFGGAAAADLFWRNIETIAVTALLLAIVGSLETVLNALSTDQQLHTRHDPNRELLAFGAGNVVSGLFGGLPVVYWRARAASLIGSGAATRFAALACAIFTAVLYLAGGRLIALLPLTVLAGIMLTVAWGLVDGWTRNLVRRAGSGERARDLWLSLLVVGVVLVVTLWRGFVAGVFLGVLLAMGLFIHAMNRSLVRARYTGAAQPSRRVYPHAQEVFLHEARARIEVLELEGALFFGNADRLAAHVEAIDPARRFIVLDCKRISTLDASAASMLSQIASRLAKNGRELLLAGVTPENRHGRALRTFGALRGAEADWFPDTDQAMEAAEQRLLAQARLAIAGTEVPLEECTLLAGLDAQQRARLAPLLQQRELQAQEILFRQGDPGDCLYVLTRGSITVSSAGGDGHRLLQRYVSFSPGMMLGETAMLDGGGRTADAVADTPSVVHALTREALTRLQAEDPALAAQLMTNIATHLSERLRHAAAAWRHSAA